MLYVLSGNDEYAILNELSQIKIDLNVGDDSLANNLVKISPDNITLELVRRHTHTLPFMGGSLLVLINGIFSAIDNSEIDNWSLLVDDLLALPSTNHVVFYEIIAPGKNLAANKLYKKIKTLAESEKNKEFTISFKTHNIPRPVNFGSLEKQTAWARGFISNYSKLNSFDITHDAALELALRVGNEPRTLASELEKLSTYSTSGNIARESVLLLTPREADENPFTIMDTIIEGSPRKALYLVRQMLEQNEENPLSLQTRITNQVRRMVVACEAIESGKNSKESLLNLSNAFPAMNNSSFPFKKLIQQSRNTSSQKCKSALRLLAEHDKLSKTGQIKKISSRDPEISLELLVLKLARIFQTQTD
jgi:DNA polymerase III delta subunit